MANEVSTKVVTGKVRFSYLHVFEPQAIKEGDEKKYSVSLIIQKSDKATLSDIKKGIEAATEIAKTKLGGKLPKNFKLPLRDGDEDREDDDAYENTFFLNASGKRKPGLVDKDLNPIMDRDDLYSGCYGRASISFYYFDSNGSKGIACGLNNLQKLKDGDALSGGASAVADFGAAPAIIDEDDDLM